MNNTMKNEFLKGGMFHNICDVRRVMDFYNNGCPHMSFDVMTSSWASFRIGRIAKYWRNNRQTAIKNQRYVQDVTEKVDFRQALRTDDQPWTEIRENGSQI